MRIGLGLGVQSLINLLNSVLNAAMRIYKNIVIADGGTVESESCLAAASNYLVNTEDSTYTDYATRVDNSIGMVEPSESETFDSTVASILAITTPSLLLIPNGRSNGKMFSLLPNDGSGDFVFTGIDANGGRTRINKAGNVEIIRRNVLPNSTTQSVWAATTGFTRTNVNIKNNRASNLSLAATVNGVDYQLGLKYTNLGAITLVNGLTYTISFRFKPNDGNGNCAYFIYAPTQIGANFNVFTGVTSSGYTENCTKVGRSITNEGNGIYLVAETFTMTANVTLTTATLTLGFRIGDLVQTIGRNADFGTPQLELSSVPTSYQESESGVSIPRIDYSSGSAGFLAEPQRTNLIQNNATFSGYTIDGGTLSSNVYTEDTVNTNHRINSAFYSGFAGNTLYCFSVIVKKTSGANRWIRLSVSDGSTGEVTSKFLNLQTGILSGSETNGGNWLATGLTTNVYTLPNGRYLLCLVAQASSLSNGLIRVGFSNDGIVTSYLGTGAVFEVLFPQAEAGTFPTSRIVTEGASKTRTGDSVFSPFFNPSAFTLYIHQTWNVIATEGFAHYLLSSLGLRAYFRSTTTQIRLYDQVNGIAFGALLIPSTNQKLILRFDGTKYNLFANGLKSADYTPTIPLNIRQIEFASKGANILGASAEIITIHKHFVENSALSDAQCIALTTL
jgi:hypothetical protein